MCGMTYRLPLILHHWHLLNTQLETFTFHSIWDAINMFCYFDLFLILAFILTAHANVMYASSVIFGLAISACSTLVPCCPAITLWNIKFNKYRENKLTVTRYIQNVYLWHEHRHASMLAIGQPRHQSATDTSLATHAADAVAAHQCQVTAMSYLRHM